MTAREAYATDAVFRALVNEWAEHRRCPAVLVDRCLDFDLESAADCARWASTAPDKTYHSPDGTYGPFPQQSGLRLAGGGWLWVIDYPNRPSCPPADRVPTLARKADQLLPEYPSPLDAILWLLDNWCPARVPA